MKNKLNTSVAVFGILVMSAAAVANEPAAPAPTPAAEAAAQHDATKHAKKLKRKESTHRRGSRDVLRGRSSDH